MIGKIFKRLTKRESDKGVEEASSRIEGLPVHVDLHSHLIPGIDDGSQSMEESLSLIRGMYELGYRRLYITPHVMSDSYRNPTERILHGLDSLRAEIEKADIPLELYAAAEYYMDEELGKRLKSGDILTIAGEYLLFETSYYSQPLNLEETIYEIASKGYTPLLAHPERYRYIKDYEEVYGRLKERGCLFQVNLNSLGGYYGKEARAKAHWLMERGWIDFVGSDLHGAKHLEFIQRQLKRGFPAALVENNTLLNDRLINPAHKQQGDAHAIR